MEKHSSLRPLQEVVLKTEFGAFLAGFSDHGLARLEFPEKKGRGRTAGAPAEHQVPARWVRATEAALQAMLNGVTPARLPPLDLSRGTKFQGRVWTALQTIPRGKTLTYGALARRIRSSSAARAVGGACGANPIPVLVPCHRVLAADGRLGGFSQGLEWKRSLLTKEGVRWAD